jgi:hypothetical protein
MLLMLAAPRVLNIGPFGRRAGAQTPRPQALPTLFRLLSYSLPTAHSTIDRIQAAVYHISRPGPTGELRMLHRGQVHGIARRLSFIDKWHKCVANIPSSEVIKFLQVRQEIQWRCAVIRL